MTPSTVGLILENKTMSIWKHKQICWNKRKYIQKSQLWPQMELLDKAYCSASTKLIKEWQTHARAAEAGRYLWRTSSPTPCSQQSSLKQVAHGHVLSGFENLHSLSVKPLPMFDDAHIEKYFLLLNGILFISVCAHCLSSYHRAPLRRVHFPLLHSLSPIRNLYTLIRVSPRLKKHLWAFSAPG